MNEGNFVRIKSSDWLEKQLVAGKCVAEVLANCNEALQKRDKTNVLDLARITEDTIKKHNCTPTFQGYKGFPSIACFSVNTEVVHGIARDYYLQPGDLISVDVGATFQGAIADAARTWIFCEPKSEKHSKMLDVCKKALEVGQNEVKIGSRIGAIGEAIFNSVKNTDYSLITKYGGHGLDWNKPHADPFVSNKSLKTEGIRITNGLSIAIEPMIVLGNASTRVLEDKWTVVADGVSCHFENSITLLDGLHVITDTSSYFY